MNAFIVCESCDLKNYMITISIDFLKEFPDLVCENSYSILAARILGLSYDDYLRYCSTCGGFITGFNTFPHVLFKQEKDAQKICDMVNKYLETYIDYLLQEQVIDKIKGDEII